MDTLFFQGAFPAPQSHLFCQKIIYAIMELMGVISMPFFLTDPKDKHRTMAELHAWETDQKKEKNKENMTQ